MVKPYNYDFKKYKKETDYQAEINKALSEGDYYGAAVNEQFRNAKIELEGLSDKYQPTFKYMYCINPDGTKNQEEIAKFEAQNSKPQEPKVANTANVTDIAKVTATPNSANGKTLKTASQILETGDKADQIKLETSVNGSAKDSATNNVAKNTTNSTSISWIYKTPSEDTYVDFTENVEPFFDTVENEITQREGVYTNKNEYNAMVTKRNEQLNLVVEKLDWYIDYFEGMNDGKDGSQEIMETVDVIRGYKEKAENLIYKMNNEKAEKDKYTTESQWLAYTDPVGALEKINSADLKNLTDEQKKEIEGLTKYLSQYNTERALVDALTLMGEGKTYEDLEAERDLTQKRLGVLRTGKGIYRSETTDFEKNLIKGYENYLAYLDMMMGYFEDVKYMAYRNREDYYSLGVPKIPEGLTDGEKKGIAERNYNKPYYYINNIFGSRDEYKVNALFQKEDLTKYNYMTESEIRTYNYIYATEGEKTANKYLDYLTNQTSYWVNEQGEYVFSETGLNYRKGKDIAQNANWVDHIEIMAKSGADSYTSRISQAFTKDPVPKTAYEYLYNNASVNGKSIMGAANDATKQLPITVIKGASEKMGIPIIGTIAGALYDSLDANYKAVQNGATPIERSNSIISAAVKSVGTSTITATIQKMLPQMSDEVKEMWTSNGNNFIKLLKKLELYALDSATEKEIKKIVETWFNDIEDKNVNVEDASQLSYYQIIKSLNKDLTFKDNKYSQFTLYEQENLKLFEKSYNEKTITEQEYEDLLKRFAKWMSKDRNIYYDYVKLLGII